MMDRSLVLRRARAKLTLEVEHDLSYIYSHIAFYESSIALKTPMTLPMCLSWDLLLHLFIYEGLQGALAEVILLTTRFPAQVVIPNLHVVEAFGTCPARQRLRLIFRRPVTPVT